MTSTKDHSSLACHVGSNLILSALRGERGVDQQRIAEVGIEWIETLLKKNSDYGSSAWQKPTLAPTLSCGQAILVRASDKIQRIQSLLEKQSDPEITDESLEDTIADLGAYMLLYLARPPRPPRSLSPAELSPEERARFLAAMFREPSPEKAGETPPQEGHADQGPSGTTSPDFLP